MDMPLASSLNCRSDTFSQGCQGKIKQFMTPIQIRAEVEELFGWHQRNCPDINSLFTTWDSPLWQCLGERH